MLGAEQRVVRARRLGRLAEVARSAGYSTSCTSVDLPEPDTPVTQTRRCSGISTSMFFRLCSRAPASSRRASRLASAAA
jgi:hypothetical protein